LNLSNQESITGANMLTTEFVENAVKQLSAEELVKFRQWYAQFDSDLWDAQIEADAAAGKLDVLAAEALAD
jgi:succinate dehydrogenase flavin-adding protein (antitoxin of CptAB toxin-antitoxin module)